MAVDLNTESKTTINSIIDDILSILELSPESDLQFKHQLFLAGYNTENKEEYDKLTFSVRKISCFQIINDFPRIKENELRQGITDVNYQINIANLDANYFISQEDLIEVFSYED
jgi:hypothetical protein